LPGSAYIFAGQELGLPDGELNDSDRQDPSFIRSKGAIKGRDGARVPLPWSGQLTPFGFTSGTPWLPINQSWQSLSVEAQSADSKSVLSLYRNAMALRAEHLTGTGDIEWLESPLHGLMRKGLLVFKRGSVTIVMNLSEQILEVAHSGQIILQSCGDLDIRDGKHIVPARSTVWILN
jgi:alpha-glucosidase